MKEKTSSNNYDEKKGYSEGLAAICVNGYWGFVDEDDNIIIEPKYRTVTEFRHGISISDWTVIDKTGKRVEPIDEDVYPQGRFEEDETSDRDPDEERTEYFFVFNDGLNLYLGEEVRSYSGTSEDYRTGYIPIQSWVRKTHRRR